VYAELGEDDACDASRVSAHDGSPRSGTSLCRTQLQRDHALEDEGGAR
jgi:hypothetical protein